MNRLEQRLVELGRELELPPTPDLVARVAPRLGERRRQPRRALVAALVLVALALAVAFAIPDARSSILRFFHLAGATVTRVDRPVSAERRAPTAGLGTPMSRRRAERAVRVRVVLPPGVRTVYVRDGLASALLPGPLLLSEIPGGEPELLKKFAPPAARIESLTVGGRPALWIEGPHAVTFPNDAERLAGNVLLWQRRGLTLRLEGPRLSRAQALRVAASLR